MNKQKFVVWLFQRLTSKQPAFYKMLQAYSLYILLAVLAIWFAVNNMKIDAHTVSMVDTICKYIIAVLVSVIGTAQTGTVKSDLISDDAKAEIINEAKTIEAAK